MVNILEFFRNLVRPPPIGPGGKWPPAPGKYWGGTPIKFSIKAGSVRLEPFPVPRGWSGKVVPSIGPAGASPSCRIFNASGTVVWHNGPGSQDYFTPAPGDYTPVFSDRPGNDQTAIQFQIRHS